MEVVAYLFCGYTRFYKIIIKAHICVCCLIFSLAADAVLHQGLWSYNQIVSFISEIGYKVSENKRIKISEIMKKYIHIQKEDREFIAKALRITERTIYNATHYEDMNEGTDLMLKIRTLALQRGGLVMVEAPEWEVLHDADGYMRQYLGDVLLEFSKTEPVCDVYKKGVKVRRFDQVMTSDIQGIQDWATGLR